MGICGDNSWCGGDMALVSQYDGDTCIAQLAHYDQIKAQRLEGTEKGFVLSFDNGDLCGEFRRQFHAIFICDQSMEYDTNNPFTVVEKNCVYIRT
eukprot:UN16758